MVQSAGIIQQANTLANQAYTAGLPQSIVSAIKHAASQTGVDFSYLLKKASQESSLDPTAKSSGSSATGLYQFTQQTWLKTVKSYGGEYGLGTYADHIDIGKNGVAHVSDPTWKKNILNLRNDPESAAEMAGALDRENAGSLQESVGGKIGGTELYLAHFLGAGGASAFLNDMHSNPQTSAASVLPDAAAANPGVFYNKDGSARTLGQIYAHFAQKFDNQTGSTLVASAATASAPTPASPNSNTTSAPQKASSVAVAALSSSFGASTGTSYASAAASLNGLKSEGSSLFATMVLAQMNDESSAFAASGKTDQSDARKNSGDVLV